MENIINTIKEAAINADREADNQSDWDIKAFFTGKRDAFEEALEIIESFIEGKEGEHETKPQKLFHVYSYMMNAETYEDFYEQRNLIASFYTKEEAERFIDAENFEFHESGDDNERYVYTTEIPDDLDCTNSMRKIIEGRAKTMKNKCYKSVIEFNQFKDTDGSWGYDEYMTHFVGYYIEEGTLG